MPQPLTIHDLYQPAVYPPDSVLARAALVRLLILDVDGVLTTGYLDYDAKGESTKSFFVRDGLGLQLLRQQGIQLAIISGRQSAVTQARASELKIHHIIQGAQDKGAALQTLLAQTELTLEQCAFIGDDVIDIPILTQVGLACSVPDGHHLARHYAHWVSNHAGGAGAVREIAELILHAQNLLYTAYTPYLPHEFHAAQAVESNHHPHTDTDTPTATLEIV